jgi:hypothetical protein
MVSPNDYNSLGLGATQLYNEPVVYNRKRHGRFELDGRTYAFRLRGAVPSRLSEEFLLVDLLHNLDRVPENKAEILPKVLKRAEGMDRKRLARAVRDYGSARARRRLAPVLAEPLAAA